MKVYISGPITNNPNYKECFAMAEAELKVKGHTVFNPTIFDEMEGLDYEEYMTLDMCMLSMCDAIYMLKGWRNSCGSNREYGYAVAKDYTILEE